MTTDFLLSECGDTKIENGDLVRVTGADQVRQSWLIHIRTFLGEWFLNLGIGVPYFQEVFEKGKTAAELKQIFTTMSLQVPGVIRVNGIIINDLDLVTRKADITAEVVVEGDETLVFNFSGNIPADACEITPASDYPKTIGDLRMWFDSQDLSNLTYAPASNLLEYQNKNGQGDATGAGTGSDYPNLIGVSPLNNKRSAFYDNLAAGSKDERCLIADTQAIRHGTGAVSIFVVTRPQDPGGGSNMGLVALTGYDVGSTSKEFYEVMIDHSAPLLRLNSERVGGSSVSRTVTYPAGEKFNSALISFIVPDSGNMEFFRNGVSLGTAATVTMRDLDGGGFVGARLNAADGSTPIDFLHGYIGEVLVYAGVLAGADLTNLHNFLINKWSL